MVESQSELLLAERTEVGNVFKFHREILSCVAISRPRSQCVLFDLGALLMLETDARWMADVARQCLQRMVPKLKLSVYGSAEQGRLTQRSA
jgi:hypothetical protein